MMDIWNISPFANPFSQFVPYFSHLLHRLFTYKVMMVLMKLTIIDYLRYHGHFVTNTLNIWHSISNNYAVADLGLLKEDFRKLI